MNSVLPSPFPQVGILRTAAQFFKNSGHYSRWLLLFFELHKCYLLISRAYCNHSFFALCNFIFVVVADGYIKSDLINQTSWLNFLFSLIWKHVFKFQFFFTDGHCPIFLWLTLFNKETERDGHENQTRQFQISQNF